MQMVVSSSFIWRRVHSLAGFWLTLYVTFHLCVNSQLNLWFDAEGHRFIWFVDWLQSFTLLPVLEWTLIGFPLLVHMVWGIVRLKEGKQNSLPSDGSTPSLPRYERNWAYTLQRASSWILIAGLALHVVQVRFLQRPDEVHGRWRACVSFDEKLKPLSQRLHVEMEVIEGKSAVLLAPDIGTAMLFVMRDLFKSPWQVAFYSLFVLAASFHACNGFWTFLLTWGFLLSSRSQRAMIPFSALWMAFLLALGFSAIWGFG